ncbi:HDOD domain-containing protein [Desulfonatronum thioautotrophicum]|uniref:HDOD domain-containing protein n=1 Tax=Desulfonatronum thioautotrophicum TaxID=617001 RepID=UPI0005EBB058|nr:HDOD domain-containing protein [Desulfonatronum thioautotrophicum]
MPSNPALLDVVQEYIHAQTTKLPVFNRTGLVIQQEMSKPEPSFQILEREISRDQALTTQLLRTANSAFYRGMRPISTIRDAILRLGTEEVANIVSMLTQQELFRTSDPFLRKYMDDLWLHSVCCASGTYWLTKRLKMPSETPKAFFAGLLHDVGKLFLLRVIEEIRNGKKVDIAMTPEFLQELIANQHAAQGYELMRHWNIPEEYCVVARDHHLESFDVNDTLLVLVRLANAACAKLGIGLHQDDNIDLASCKEAMVLDISEVKLAELEIRLEDTLAFLNANLESLATAQQEES